ncbi:glycosyltransferase [Tenacibaculum sp. IB213877]|uniref:glycosyltransferase n=1 Tax=Tenacibaculum sp. IB213877 TaxID=3097351 RepID=UPI002A5A6810|nr:glycosyltransferase [Tenacibaculum sp. IB213877]MDY0779208.1 glycosyltransferase [Tenacibaculum sp. IB213877]
MNLKFSIIVPVYNRPAEVDELLESLTKQDFQEGFEVIIVEDGSENTAEKVVEKYTSQLDIKYFFKKNSGPGASRNYGMQRAMGDYFIILDSDVIVPLHYLSEVKKALTINYSDAFGGPDASHENFTNLQKAINYSMTSVLTTGGIRGKKKSVGKFQPRSFNMGISKKAFEVTQGFADYRVGEDIDLTFRLWKSGFKTQLIEKAFVYHKRRSTISQFFKQTFAFGTARPQLNKRYPETAKITYWFPSLFLIGFDISLIFWFFGYWQLIACYGFYFLAIFIDSLLQNKNIKIAFLSIVTTFTQFLGYGLGFLESKFMKK